jgi:hypothetical protein
LLPEFAVATSSFRARIGHSDGGRASPHPSADDDRVGSRAALSGSTRSCAPRLYVFDAGGHMAMFERPEEFNVLALEFFAAGGERSAVTAAAELASDESPHG